MNKNYVLVKFSKPKELVEGSEVEFTDANGVRCVLTITTLKDQMALADSSSCSNLVNLKPGKILEPVLTLEQGRSKKKLTKDGNQFGLRLYYSSANFIYNRYVDQATNTTTNFVDRTSAGLGISLRHAHFTKNFIFLTGIGYEFTRKFSNRSLDDGTKIEYNNGEGLSLNWIDFNIGLLLANQLFLYGGINYNSPKLIKVKDVTIAGDIGYQVGIGYLATHSLSFDLGARFVSFKMSEKALDADGNEINRKFTLSLFDGATFGLTYSF
jgi:hypothetical protein